MFVQNSNLTDVPKVTHIMLPLNQKIENTHTHVGHWFICEVDRKLSRPSRLYYPCGMPYPNGMRFKGMTPGVSPGNLAPKPEKVRSMHPRGKFL